MTNPEELRRKLSSPKLPTAAAAAASNAPGSSNLSSPPSQPPHQPLHQFQSLPLQSNAFNSGAMGPNSRMTEMFVGRGHSRSVSHGGGSAATPTALGSAGRPLRSAMKGHQRALSQGQIADEVSPPPPRSGHSRVGSRTDFILPPGHKEEPLSRDAITSAGSLRGHSRQASRSESIYTLRRTEIPPWWKRHFFASHFGKFDDQGYRIVVPNHTVPPKTPKSEHPNERRIGNKIRTTKYTLLSFLPKNLLEQFHRVANLYFIFIVVLNWFIDAFGKEVSLIPVLFVLGVTAIKDLFEDRRRRASDKRINNSTCRIYNG